MNLSGILELQKIALRNLARHKVKTALTAAAITISVAVYIFISSFIGGMSIESRRNIVNYDMAAAKLQTKMYFERKDEKPAYENFKEWERYRGALGRAGYNTAPRFAFSGMIFSNSASTPMTINAVLDSAAEAQVLHYTGWIDFGRYPQNGKFEIAVGTMAAEKLKVGIPTRPRKLELDELVEQAATNKVDEDFIRSLYDEMKPLGNNIFSAPEKIIEGNERMILRRGASREDLTRLWDMIAATKRNEVRINTVIDIKAVPEAIRPDKWDGELMPELRAEDIALVKAAYRYEEFMDAYMLIEEDEQKQNEVLTAMIRAGYRGAVRHINQLVDAVVVGVINSPDPVPNGYTAYIPMDVLQDEAGMMLEGAVTEILIRAKDAEYTQLPGGNERAAAITAALERELGEKLPNELAVFFWMEYMKNYLSYEATESSMSHVLAGLLLLLSFLGISNTILLAILERTKETGMMRAMGMTDGQMIMAYMFEAGFLGLIGSVLGIILGCAVNYPAVKYGFDIGAMSDTLGGGIGYRVTAMMRSVWNIPLIIGSGIVATLLSACMAYFPTRRAVKMSITDSLRFE